MAPPGAFWTSGPDRRRGPSSGGSPRCRSACRRCKAPLLGLDAAVRGHEEGGADSRRPGRAGTSTDFRIWPQAVREPVEMSRVRPAATRSAQQPPRRMSGCRPEGLQGEEARNAPLAMGPAGVCSGWLLDWQDAAKADDGQRAGPRPRCRACYLRGMGSWPGMLLQRRPCRFASWRASTVLPKRTRALQLSDRRGLHLAISSSGPIVIERLNPHIDESDDRGCWRRAPFAPRGLACCPACFACCLRSWGTRRCWAKNRRNRFAIPPYKARVPFLLA